jgi:hypothetical protein
MVSNESLSSRHRFEPLHASFPNPGRLVRLLGPIMRILASDTDRFRDNLPMGNGIAAQLISDNPSGFTAMISR